MLIVKRRGKRMETWGRPSLKVLEGPIELFTHTIAVWFMKLSWQSRVNDLGHPGHFRLLYNGEIGSRCMCNGAGGSR